MKKIMSLLLALTMILSFGSFMASAAPVERTDATPVAPTNYGQVGDATVKGMNGKTCSKIFDDADNDTIDTGTDCLSLQNIHNNSRETNNTFFVVKLTNEQYVSALAIDQYKSRIKKYRIFATADEELGEEVFAAAANDMGLTEYGKVHKIKGLVEGTTNKYEVKETISYNDENEVYTIDKLYAADALVASGTLTPDDAVTTEKNIFYFNEPVKAKYIIFVVDSTLNMSYGTPIDCIEVLGMSEKNSTDITQYPKQSSNVNYADQLVFPAVKICSANKAEEELTKYGDVDVLVNPNNNTIVNAITYAPTFLLWNTNENGDKAKNPYSWFAIDLGEVRSFDTIQIYQCNDRLSEIEIYTLTETGYNKVDSNGGLHLSETFMSNAENLTFVQTSSVYHTGSASSPLNTGETLTTPSNFKLDNVIQAQYVLVRVSGLVNANNGAYIRRVMVKDSTPIASYENAYVEGGIDYTAKFVNDSDATKQYALVTAQYNEAGEMIAHSVEYVNVAPLYAKSFAGKVTKVDTAKQIKVFSVCLTDLTPLETQYTFNIQ